MTEQDRKKYEEASKKYLKTLSGISYRSAYEFGIHTRTSFTQGCSFAHSLLEERIKEGYNKALDDAERLLYHDTRRDYWDGDDLLEEIKKLRK
jgi:hypothetical protein